MKKYNVAILGATGAVGREMIKLLEERDFPINSVKFLASKRSVGKLIPFCGKEVAVEEATCDSFQGMDIVLGAASNALAKEMAPHIVKAGAVFIDNSSAFRMHKDVPLVVPEINPDDAKEHKGIIANPNCSTIITLVAINALNKLSPIKTVIASTYQAVSGAGAGGPLELEAQTKAILNGEEIKTEVFSHQIAENLIPKIGSGLQNGYTTEEMKMQNEGRKIMHIEDLLVSCTCIRVPVVRSHSISVIIRTEDEISVEDARNIIASAPGCKLVDDLDNNIFPMPIDTSDQNLVYVGRIRKDLTCDKGINLWCCGDQVRKGAALNAIQIAELFI